MGHIIGKDIYKELGKKIDNTPVRTPWNADFQDMLKSLYSVEEAELVVKMPYRPSSLERVSHITGFEKKRLSHMLDTLCAKGLVLDTWDGREYQYMISPIVIGIFEFTMMRTGKDLSYKKWAEIFNNYMFGSNDFLEANFGDGQQVSIMRAMPHEEVIKNAEYVEILDYEKASHMIESNEKFAVGLCSCRHEKMHLGEQGCDVPLETCTTMGEAADFIIRNNFGREICKSEMQDILDRSKDMGFTLSTDNVKQNPGFICHCCGCCCNLMKAVRETGYNGILVTSTFMAKTDLDACNGCGLCAKACPIDAIEIQVEEPTVESGGKKIRKAVIDESICLGCGVCALKCKQDALTLEKREQKVLHPENSIERVLLQSLERGTLQNLIFDNPNSKSHEFMRGVLGAFFKLSPVQKAMMSDTLRSRFFSALK
ncbi:MAG: 4Fe-4S binding protein [Desulfovibrio sp.]